ncbi:MAG: hypothetical protein ACM3UL_00905 [Ignavibacteria bacterium]
MMLQEKKSVRVIAKAWVKTRDCIRIKLAGVEVVVQGEKNTRTTTSCPSLVLPVELSSIEETVKTLVRMYLQNNCKVNNKKREKVP